MHLFFMVFKDVVAHGIVDLFRVDLHQVDHIRADTRSTGIPMSGHGQIFFGTLGKKTSDLIPVEVPGDFDLQFLLFRF